MALLRYIFYTLCRGTQRLLPPHLRRLSQDRRGVTALVFAMLATGMLGMIGLATEAGAWYLIRAQESNVADAAAIAGSLASLAQETNPDAPDPIKVAKDFAASNGYPGVTASSYSSQSDTNYTNGIKVEISFDVDVAPFLTRYLPKNPTITLTVRSVAGIRPVGTACALSLKGDLVITQDQSGLVGGVPYCFYASNAPNDPPNSVGVDYETSGQQLAIWGFTTTGDCPNCLSATKGSFAPLTGGGTGGTGYFPRPNSSFQPSTTPDPAYSIIYNMSLPTKVTCPTGLTYTDTGTDPATGAPYTPYTFPSANLDTLNCPTTPNPQTTIAGTLMPATGDGTTCAPASGTYCGYYNMNVTVAANTTLALQINSANVSADKGSNTYFFVNASLTINDGATIQCQVYDENQGNGSGTNFYSCMLGSPAAGMLGMLFPASHYGVTIVLTPDKSNNVGTLTIASGASAYLSAPLTNDYSDKLNGILFFRRGVGTTESASGPGVTIIDTSTGGTQEVLLSGGMYFPDSFVSFSANTYLSPDYLPMCSVVVAAYLTLGFPAAPSPDSADLQSFPTQLETDRCQSADFQNNTIPAYGTPPLIVRAAQIVE